MMKAINIECRVGLIKESILVYHQDYSVEIFAPDKFYGVRQLKGEVLFWYREMNFKSYDFCLN